MRPGKGHSNIWSSNLRTQVRRKRVVLRPSIGNQRDLSASLRGPAAERSILS